MEELENLLVIAKHLASKCSCIFDDDKVSKLIHKYMFKDSRSLVRFKKRQNNLTDLNRYLSLFLFFLHSFYFISKNLSLNRFSRQDCRKSFICQPK